MSRIKTIVRQPRVQEALASFTSDLDVIIEETIAVQQVPAPTFAEDERAAFIQKRFEELDLLHIERDELQNVYGCLPGRRTGPPLIVSAHSDTVFSADTDLSVRRNGRYIYGPGIADNSLGVAGMLQVIRALRKFELVTEYDIWFVANVGEEGLGDLRGMRAVVERFGDARAYLVIEGGLFGRICHQAIGVRRFRIEIETPGGHSWGAFGAPSAVHSMARLIAAISAIETPAIPKTTFNVGVVEGGTTVNTIASRAHFLLDLRSEDPQELDRLVRRIERLVQDAGAETDVSVRMQVIGDRPAGSIERDQPVVRWAGDALRAVGAGSLIEYTTGSTDANIPLSQGLPTVCIGLTQSANAHRTDEYLDITHIPAGVGQLLLLLLAAAELT